MIILLFGEDNYRLKEKLREIISHYKKIHKSGLNLIFLDLKEKSFEDFKMVYQPASMFVEKKLIILKNATKNPEFKRKFLESKEKFKDSKEIILFSEEEKTKDEFLETIKKIAMYQEFKNLEGEKLESWIRREFKKYGAEIEKEGLEKLIEFVGNDLWQMSNEIKKLVAYKNKPCQGVAKIRIEKKDVELLVKPKEEPEIFKTIDAIALKNKKRVFRLIKNHLQKGDSPQYLLSMINFQFRNILMIKDLMKKGKSLSAILRESKLHPFSVKKSYYLAQKFDLEELKKIYQKVFQMDLNVKTGKIKPESALESFLIEI
jgi:DNA polymerase-3 subunit delta